MTDFQQKAGGIRWPSVAALAASAAATLFFFLPLHSVLSLDENGRVFLALVIGLVLTSAVRPAAGLTMLVLLLPLTGVIQAATHYTLPSGDVVDGLMLSFACGASARLFVRDAPAGTRLAGPAAVLAVVILTSTVSELRALQAVTPRDPVWPAIWHHVTNEYWTDVRAFPVLRHTFRWLAWLAAAVYTERLIRTSGLTRSWVLRAWWAAGLGGALIALQRMLTIVVNQPEPFWASMIDFWRRMRLTVLQPDVNAAGSYLLLFLIPAIVVGVRERSRWLIAAWLPLLLAFGMARSRAAIGAGVAVLCAAAIAHLWFRPRGDRAGVARRHVLVVAVVMLGAVVLGGTYLATAYSHANLSDAMRIRVDLAATGWEGLKRHAAFGVGLGDYIPSTRRFMTEDMALLRAFAPQGENAHNNFLQLAVELGVPALLLFLWLVARAVVRGLAFPGNRPDPHTEGLALGVIAFLLSAVFGHPLLVPLAGATCFLAMGLCAGQAAVESGSRAEAAGWIVAGMYLGSLLWR